MKKSLIACVAAVSLLLTSCGIHIEPTSNSNVIQTGVVLSQNNFRIVRMVSAETCQTYILGIGGLSKESLAESTMAKMYQKANLKGSEAIINTNISIKTESYGFVYTKKRAIATGTVIEFFDPAHPPKPLVENKTDEAPVYVPVQQPSAEKKVDEAPAKPESNKTPSIQQKKAEEKAQKEARKQELKQKKAESKESNHQARASQSANDGSRAYFTLSFMSKRKNSTVWNVVEEKTVYATFEEADKMAKEWDNQVSEYSEYKCNIRKTK